MKNGSPTIRSIQARPMINVTPLIDVLLVLLIIFMVIAPMAPRLYAAKLPQQPPINDDRIIEDLSLVVTVNADRTYGLNTEKFASLSELGGPFARGPRWASGGSLRRFCARSARVAVWRYYQGDRCHEGGRRSSDRDGA